MAERIERNDLDSVQRAGREQMEWYADGLDDDGGPYVWYTGGVPIEILYAMDLTPVMPENYVATMAARGRSGENLDAAYAMGWGQDVCSYCRQGFGMLSEEFDAADQLYGGLPDPDVLVTHRGTCDTQQEWFEEYNRQLDVPIHVIDVPQTGCRADEHPADVEYYRRQLEETVAFLETHTGRSADETALWRVIERSDRLGELWKNLCASTAHSPAPFTVSDRFKLMGIPALFAGTQRGVDLLAAVWSEVQERIDAGVGAAATETYRLLWDDIAIWYDLELLYRLESEGFVFVADTYSDPFGFLWKSHEYPSESMVDYELDDPLAALARPYVRNLQRQWRVDRRLEYFPEWIDYFDVDGVVFHSNRSCRPYSLSQLLIQRELDVPNALVDADHTDPHAFSESQAKLRLDAMKEQIRGRDAERGVPS